MDRTDDYQVALKWASAHRPEGVTPSVWIPKSGFQYAIQNDDGSVSFTRDGNPNFGLGIGPDPIIDENWQRFALPRNLAKEKTLKFKLVNRWDPYQISTCDFKDFHGASEIDTTGIKEFLDENAPESSVYPGNPETIFWAGLRVNNELVAIGSVGIWESGKPVISSIATKISERGKGYGTAITAAIVAICNKRGIEKVFLAVNAKNEVASRVYEKIGFQSIGKFNTFER